MARDFLGGSGRGPQVPGVGVALALVVEATGEDGAVGKEDSDVGGAGGTHTAVLLADGTVVARGLDADHQCDTAAWDLGPTP